jgi:hypothetical protein
MTAEQAGRSAEKGAAESAGREDVPGQDQQPNWDWKSQLAVILTAFSAVFIALRLLSVSAFEIETANAILQNIGTTAVIVGTLTAVVGPLIPIVSVTIVALAGDQFRKIPVYIILAAAGVAVIAVVFVSPVIFILFTLIALPVAILNLYGLIPVKPTLVRSCIIVAVAILFIAVALGTDPWLPSEKLVFSNFPRPVVGYVLSTTDGTIAVLENKPREVKYFKAQNLISRTLCSLTRSAASSLANPLGLPNSLFGVQRANYPPCDARSPHDLVRH